MNSLIVIFTSHDRMDKTRECLYSLDDPGYDIRYIAVDDGCTDKTVGMIERFAEEKSRKVDILHGDGTLFWAGGMRKGMEYVLDNGIISDHVLLINDDVKFFEQAIKRMIDTAVSFPGSCIAGATCGRNGKITYGGFRYEMNSVREIRIGIFDPDRWCDAANMNAFLMPYDVFRRMGVFDRHYTHKMADYDYCFGLKRIGVKVYMTEYYAGICEIRTKKGTWEDRELSRIKRLRLKEQPKGLPAGEWFYFLKKNFGMGYAIRHSITPYLRIIIGR